MIGRNGGSQPGNFYVGESRDFLDVIDEIRDVRSMQRRANTGIILRDDYQRTIAERTASLVTSRAGEISDDCVRVEVEHHEAVHLTPSVPMPPPRRTSSSQAMPR